MDKKYYLLNRNIKTGPFTLEELQISKIPRHCLIWTEVMNDWESVETISELKELILELPPLPPPTPYEIDQIQNKQALKDSFKDSTKFLLMLSFALYLLAGGNSSDQSLREKYLIYKSSNDSFSSDFFLSFSSIEVFRYATLPLICLGFSFIISIFIWAILFSYYRNKRKIKYK